jgi:probable F420-dependent oxidoreductase
MEFWQAIAHTETEQLVEFARLAEGYGFAGVSSGDHFVTPARVDSPYPYTADHKRWEGAKTSIPDPLMLAAALAQVTRQLRFMTTAYILPMHELFAAAKAISSAAVLSQDRLVLGVGVGWMREEFELTGSEFARRGRRCDEMLEVIGKLLAGGMVEHHGEFYDFPPCEMCPVPSQPVPVLIAGDSDAALRRAARFDGWVGAHYDVEAVPPLVERFHKARARADRAGAPAQVVVAINELSHPDQVRRLEDAGATALIHMPLTFRGLPASTLETKRQAMERFAERFMGRARSS